MIVYVSSNIRVENTVLAALCGTVRWSERAPCKRDGSTPLFTWCAYRVPDATTTRYIVRGLITDVAT